jgi:hypothetical protein
MTSIGHLRPNSSNSPSTENWIIAANHSIQEINKLFTFWLFRISRGCEQQVVHINRLMPLCVEVITAIPEEPAFFDRLAGQRKGAKSQSVAYMHVFPLSE